MLSLDKFFRKTVLVSLLVGLVGFGSLAVAQDTTTLTMWSWRTEDVDVYNNVLLPAFEAKNPGIKVEFRAIKASEYNAVLATALEGNEGPDVMQLRAYGSLQRFIPFLQPVGDKLPGLQAFPSSSIKSAQGVEDGLIYGVPFANQVLGIYYNKQIFNELGLTEPKTWDEFIAINQTLKDNGIQPLANAGAAAWMLEIIFGTVGPNFYGGNGYFNDVVAGKTTFEDSRFVTAIEKELELKEFMPNGFIGVDYTSQQAAFFTEQAAMFIGGSFEAKNFQAQNPDLQVGVFPAPTAKAGQTPAISTWADGSFGINKTTEKTDAALKLLSFMTTKEWGNLFTNTLGQISPVPGVEVDREKVPVLSKFVDFLDQFEVTPYIMLVAFRFQRPTGSEAIQADLQALLQGQMTSEEVAQDVQQQVATWYKPFQN